MPLALDAMAQRYGRLPHEVAALDAAEFTFNWMCMMVGNAEDMRTMQEAQRKSPMGVVPVFKIGGRT